MRSVTTTSFNERPKSAAKTVGPYRRLKEKLMQRTDSTSISGIIQRGRNYPSVWFE